MGKVKKLSRPKTQEEVPEMPEMSREEIAARKAEMSAFYTENLEHLKIQLEYEEHLTKIEKTRAERLQAQMFMMQAYAAQEGSEPGEMNKEAAMEFEKAKAEA
jgi:hypothetical protein